MNPLELRVKALEEKLNALIRCENVEFIKSAQRNLGVTPFANSSKTADSEDVTINESGASTKVVLSDPVGWIRFGANKNVPIYND